jgi:hypothetical protein
MRTLKRLDEGRVKRLKPRTYGTNVEAIVGQSLTEFVDDDLSRRVP